MKKQTAPEQPPSLTPGLRRYLYFTASITGGAIMVVEILGAKMLAPFLGTSHFVWTAQIAVTMVALAFGYYAGGWLVDRSPRLGRLYTAILAAAIYLCISMLFIERVAFACLDAAKLATGSLLASAFLFFVPLSLLAMTGPFFIRVLTVDVSGVGSNVGRLSAISTMGSFVGTVLIGYVLIPYFPNSVTLYITAIVLMAVVAGYAFGWGRKSTSVVANLIAMGFGLLLGYAAVAADTRTDFNHDREVYRANSNFGQLQVLETSDGSRRVYLNDYLTQNGYYPKEKQSTYLFTYMLHGLTHAYRTNIKDVLCIGMGVGIVPMKFAHEGVVVDVVEINDAVVPLAQKYFDLQPEKLNLVIGDGRQFVNKTAKKYDAIVLDAFLGDSSPSHLMTREAFDAMRRALKPGGVLVINSFGDFEPSKDYFTASITKTLKAVFQSVRIHYSESHGNVFFAASDVKDFKVVQQIDLASVHPSLQADTQEGLDTIREANPLHGIVLTDDYNPADFYDAANREAVRRNLVSHIRRR